MRDILLVPLDDPLALDTALRSGAGGLLDLGDADAPGDRAARRRAALGCLRDCGPGRGLDGRPGPATIVRVAPLASGLVDADLDAVLPGAPDAVLLPGAVGGADLQHLAAKLAVGEAEHGRPAGRTGIVAAPAGTAAGVLALGTLAGATPRLRALLWDPAPLAGALGTALDASPLRTARDLLVFAAAACGVPAIDGDPGAADDALRDGFAGRLVRVP